MHLDAKLAGGLDKALDQVRIEPLQRAGAPVDDLDLGAGASRNMRELEGDVAPSHEDDLAWQPVELQELCARGQVLLARDREHVTMAAALRALVGRPAPAARLESHHSQALCRCIDCRCSRAVRTARGGRAKAGLKQRSAAALTGHSQPAVALSREDFIGAIYDQYVSGS